MISKELIKQIRRIEIRTCKMVDDVFSGEYGSIFKGRGIEFSEVREYQPGDDIRIVDWNVTARFGRPFVKKFIEERELTVMLAVDLSASERFGSQLKSKAEIASEIAAIIGFSALKNNDKVGLILFTDRIEKFIPPGKGRRHTLRMVRDILFFEPQHHQTDIDVALRYINDSIKRRAIVFLLSDFLGEGFQKSLRITSKKHDLILISLSDPREEEILPVGLVELEDCETGEVILINTQDKTFISEYSRWADKSKQERRKLLATMDIDHIELSTGKSYLEPLIAFFQERAKRLR